MMTDGDAHELHADEEKHVDDERRRRPWTLVLLTCGHHNALALKQTQYVVRGDDTLADVLVAARRQALYVRADTVLYLFVAPGVLANMHEPVHSAGRRVGCCATHTMTLLLSDDANTGTCGWRH